MYVIDRFAVCSRYTELSDIQASCHEIRRHASDVVTEKKTLIRNYFAHMFVKALFQLPIGLRSGYIKYTSINLHPIKSLKNIFIKNMC